MTDLEKQPCFYVSVVDGARFALLAGPFRLHDTAIILVDLCNRIASEMNAWGWFYAYGTVKMKDGVRKGVLNDKVDYEELLAWEALH